MDYDYEDWTLGLIDGSEEDPTQMLEQEAIEDAMQRSESNVEHIINNMSDEWDYDSEDILNQISDALGEKSWRERRNYYNGLSSNADGSMSADELKFNDEESEEIIRDVLIKNNLIKAALNE